MEDTECMELALAEAAAAMAVDEIPVGAVVVDSEGRVISQAHNRPLASHDPSAHAEILALRAAGEALGNYRLSGCDLFVTLEPCAMCAGALVHARIRRLVYGATDPKGGAVVSRMRILEEPHWNHKVEAVGGLLAEESAALLQRFFALRRGREPTGGLPG